MGFFRRYPYTNLHEMNLDWLIEKIGELEEKVRTASTPSASEVVFTPSSRINSNNVQAALEEVDNKIVGVENATKTKAGIVKIGNNLDINNGVLSAPLAKANTAGMVKVGDGLEIDNNGILSAIVQEVPTASKEIAGIVQIGDGLEVDENGLISVDSSASSETYRQDINPPKVSWTDYYVSNANGSDSGDGSASNPFKYLQTAIAAGRDARIKKLRIKFQDIASVGDGYNVNWFEDYQPFLCLDCSELSSTSYTPVLAFGSTATADVFYNNVIEIIGPSTKSLNIHFNNNYYSGGVAYVGNNCITRIKRLVISNCSLLNAQNYQSRMFVVDAGYFKGVNISYYLPFLEHGYHGYYFDGCSINKQNAAQPNIVNGIGNTDPSQLSDFNVSHVFLNNCTALGTPQIGDGYTCVHANSTSGMSILGLV